MLDFHDRQSRELASPPDLANCLRSHINRERLLETARRLISIHSPTGRAGAVSDELAAILTEAGFTVERPVAGHPDSPAVVARLDSSRPGRTLQFNGHLDTVHLPFVPHSVDGDLLHGSGASDMKGGIAAAVEALFALRDWGKLEAGSVLLTAHDLHEAPWGFGAQLDRMITDGILGDAVLLPEPLSSHLPIAGRGQACWKVTIRRDGPPVHEVMRPMDAPNVLLAGAELVRRLAEVDARLARSVHPVAGRASVFVGQIHGGEIYNQYPSECWVEGTRRWIPDSSPAHVRHEFDNLLAALARDTGTTLDVQYQVVRDAFDLDPDDPFLDEFRDAYRAVSGEPPETGPKPFVDDGNSFTSLGKVPAITHGPRAGGQHTLAEWASIDDLVRVAHLYATTAAIFCPRG